MPLVLHSDMHQQQQQQQRQRKKRRRLLQGLTQCMSQQYLMERGCPQQQKQQQCLLLSWHQHSLLIIRTH
jgi:hypothetical protein